MSGCDHAIEHIYFYLDHEINWYRRLRIRRHLRKCNYCCGAFEFEERLLTVVRERGRDDLPEELLSKLRALIRHEAAEEPEA